MQRKEQFAVSIAKFSFGSWFFKNKLSLVWNRKFLVVGKVAAAFPVRTLTTADELGNNHSTV